MIGTSKIIATSKIAMIAAVAAIGIVSPAFAQSRSTFGSVLPLTYDSEGTLHFDTFGYS